MNKAITLIAVLSAVGATVVCHQLLLKHITGTSGSSWFEAGCSESAEEGGADCAAVLASPYSYIPPKFEDSPKHRPHFPAAFVGMVYYSVLAVWLLGIGRPSRAKRWLHAFPMLLVTAGLLGSAYFLNIMFSKLDEWCPWCLVTHILNGLIAACLLLMWPRRPRGLEPAPVGEEHADSNEPAIAPAIVTHPSGRLFAVTVAAVMITIVANYQLMAHVGYARQVRDKKRDFDLCMVALKRVSEDPAKLVGMWRKQRKWDIAVRRDDPIRWLPGARGDGFQVIIFSDFECPVCKRISVMFEEKVQPLFGGNLQIVFKHFPLNPDCNPEMQRRKHEHACDGARIAEGARLIGGNEAFWLAHDNIFERQGELTRGTLTPESVAVAIGLDPDELVAAMQDPEVDKRIIQDVAEGRFHDVGGTPSVFLDGRLVDALTRNEITFWDRIADIYWKKRKEPRPESTELSNEAATRDSLDQPAAP